MLNLRDYTQKGSEPMVCPNCGQPLPDTAKMCYSCRTKFEVKVDNKPDEKPGLTPGGIILAIIVLIIAGYMLYLAFQLGEQKTDNIFGVISSFYQFL